MLGRGEGGSSLGIFFAILAPSSQAQVRARPAEEIMTRWTLALALAAALCGGFIAAPALAQNTPTKLRPKTSESASTVTVVVTNSRKADLVQLQATESGLVGWKKVLGALKSGNHASAQLPHPFNCRVDLHGTFSDGQSMDASDVDVCAQKTLNLTD
jgi:hypothetical protein